MYEKLLLANGGGVTGDSQKGKQAQNCVNIIIGLGGTGKFCIRMTKTYAYQRLNFEQGDANGVFQRIRFLAIDTDLNNEEQEKDSNVMELTRDEFLDIQHKDILTNMGPAPWNDWWKKEEKDDKEKRNRTACNEGVGNGASGFRQKGRLFLSYAAGGIVEKIRGIYNAATEGVNLEAVGNGTSANIFFHVVSGLGGGTGSGTFIDICYLLKKHFARAKVIGHFFLPEVNEDVVAAEDTKSYIRQNGFAAMQDLDYVMQIGNNYGAFQQAYNRIATPVDWDGPPVDMCHIISNQGAVGLGTGKAKYNYAMNVVAEYIMDFLVVSSDSEHNLISEIDNKDSRINVRENDRASGYYCGYSSMGSSCAIVPYREINTYVISNLFSKFSQIFRDRGITTPSAKDCFDIIKEAIAPNAATQDDLNLSVMQKVASGINVGQYDNYRGSLKEINWERIVTDEEILRRLRGDLQIPQDLCDWYMQQFSNKMGIVTRNTESLSSPTNTESLINAIKRQLDTIVCRIEKGPSFALKAIDSSEKESLKNIIDGIIASNRILLNYKITNLPLRAKDYNDAVDVIKRKGYKRKRGEIAENALMAYFSLLGEIEMYEGIIRVLNTLKEQLCIDAKRYYTLLENAYRELRARFNDNLNALMSDGLTVVDISYAEYLITLNQIKDALDAELEAAVTDIPNAYSKFMSWITMPEKRGLMTPEHQGEFINHVKAFFIDDETGLFNGLVKMKIDDYLRMAIAHDNNITDWHAIMNDQVQRYVKARMDSLVNRAQPMLGLNIGIQDNLGPPTGWLTIPDGSAAIAAAAAEVDDSRNIRVSSSKLSDRIFIEMRHDGIAMSAAVRVPDMEAVSDQDSARHLYSGTPSLPGVFNNWGNLPPLTPYQKWAHNNNRFFEVDSAADVFDRALKCKLIVPVRNDFNGPETDFSNGIQIREFNTDAIKEAQADLIHLKTTTSELSLTELLRQKEELLADVGALEGRLDNLFTPVKTYQLNFALATRDLVQDPHGVEHRKAFYRDMFVRAPQLVMNVKQQLQHVKEYEDVIADVAACRLSIEESCSEAETESRVLPIFESALYTGMLKIEGNDISCEFKDEQTGENLVPEFLSKASRRDDFPYWNIPIYQAFCSFKTLDPKVIEEIGNTAAAKANRLFEPGSTIDAEVERFMGRMTIWLGLAKESQDSKRIIDFLRNEAIQFKYFKEERGL